MQEQDRDLIDRFLAQQTAAEQQVDRTVRQAASPYRARLGHDWEDAVQEVRFELWSLLREGTFRGDSSLRNFIFRVTNHSMIDVLRRRGRGPLRVPLEEPGNLPTHSVRPPPMAPEERALLLDVLQRVPEECRQLWRQLLRGHSYREMSRRSGVSEGALRVRVLRCRRRATALRADLLGEAATADVTELAPGAPGGAKAVGRLASRPVES